MLAAREPVVRFQFSSRSFSERIAVSTAVFLGAGFSAAAGLPLAGSMFDSGALPPHRKTEETWLEATREGFKIWRLDNPDCSVEEWLLSIYSAQTSDLFGELQFSDNWKSALSFLLRNLAEVAKPDTEPYYYGISRYACHPNHCTFWELIKRAQACTIVTTNYDILIERALHAKHPDGSTSPEFNYGGFPYPFSVRKMVNISAPPNKRSVPVQLGSKYNVYKLHGSLNWAFEHHQTNMKCHDDVRAVFRTTDQVGAPALIPPLPEKELPEAFATIWNQASRALREARSLVVCGYSLPPYDHHMRKWLTSTFSTSGLRRVAILDPYSVEIAQRWTQVLPSNCKITPMSALPLSAENGELERFLA